MPNIARSHPNNMDARDHFFLRLQFRLKLHELSGSHYQSFVENILELRYPTFKRVNSAGGTGDGGNDGFREDEGVYYQIYSPERPEEKAKYAGTKLIDDFAKLKARWDQICEVKEYVFVFNDKRKGTYPEVESALTELRNANPLIKFRSLLSAELESEFFALSLEDILSMGFDVEPTRAVENAYKILSIVETYLDRGNAPSARDTIDGITTIIGELGDDKLQLEFELLRGRTSIELELIDDAKQEFSRLADRFTDDPRPLLYLAHLDLIAGNYESNEVLLCRASEIDANYWYLQIQRLSRTLRLEVPFDLSTIDESSFPADSTQKAYFYRLYSMLMSRSGDHARAMRFADLAIASNPNRAQSYIAKIDVLEQEVFEQLGDKERFRQGLLKVLDEIEEAETLFDTWSKLSARTQATLGLKRMNAYRGLENNAEFARVSKSTFESLIQCSFDQMIDSALTTMLRYVSFPPSDFSVLQTYLTTVRKTGKQLSSDLSKSMMVQYLGRGTVLTEVRKFFESIGDNYMLALIGAIENGDFDAVWQLIKDDVGFSGLIASVAKTLPELRKKIIENLPNNGGIQKEKLELLLSYDEKRYDDAFEILKNTDFSNLDRGEGRMLLDIVIQKKAWEFVIVIVDKLLQSETDYDAIVRLKVEHFKANLHLERYYEAARDGEGLLEDTRAMSLLVSGSREEVLGHTINSYLRRSEDVAAKTLLEKHSALSGSFEFKLGVEAEVYLRNNDINKALDSVVAAAVTLKTPTPEQYGLMFFVVFQICERLPLSMHSESTVVNNSFVRFVDQERWYFIGDGEPLDATKVESTDSKYEAFIGKKCGEFIQFGMKYGSRKSEHTILMILPLERYICWQSVYNMQQLTDQQRWNKVESIQVSTTGEDFNPEHLIARLKEDHSRSREIFDMFCDGKVPFAFLALCQGGLTGALGRITREQKGFINFCSNGHDFANQTLVAERVIGGEVFYIDGTTALILAECGLLKAIHQHLPNLKVPQSVITYLLETKERFTPLTGVMGHVGYAQDKVTFVPFDRKKAEIVRNNFALTISLLESVPQNVVAISGASRGPWFCEQQIPSYLCDACILAQRDGFAVLTEDFGYLHVNKMESSKDVPDYFSLFAMVKLLYDKRLLKFDEYLQFFGTLAYYRFRFLPVSTADLQNAFYGDGVVKFNQTERLKYFNLSLILSEDYGVREAEAFRVILSFLTKIVVDDSVLIEIADKTFSELLFSLPSKRDKKTLGRTMVFALRQLIKKSPIDLSASTSISRKLVSFSQIADRADRKDILLF